ncbi:DUF3410 domain-containing protein [Pantoea sp. Mhis]|uniref:DUF3410 domain-containing protein n=1 Tax=Pantoea sp. Mhis TaxID=2576759 RepID=UPI00135964DB|nr:DUF3410 domain-containing protein [Pantoea sp. Mhis]MXP56084.1 DUF3410 domain-containing protein [Pantoea sp. Mhis]
MKILVDENMPHALELFSQTGEVMIISGRQIPIDKLKNANGLMVRSLTNINAKMLANTSVKFVGTATSGTDHIDYVSLSKAGITFCAAPGCNAIAVVEYVICALLFIAERDNFNLFDRTVGIIGVGNIGNHLYNRLKVLGVKTLLCDPLRTKYGNYNEEDFTTLDELVSRSNIVTFHTSLLKNGLYRSWHLANFNLLMKLQPNTILINTSRGPVVDNSALLKVLNIRKDLTIILDVWENEPNLLPNLLNKIDIATPHIAGYTVEGKLRGTIQIFEAWCKFIHYTPKIVLEKLLPSKNLSEIKFPGKLNQSNLKKLSTLIYDISYDDMMLRKVATSPTGFDYLRKTYQERREWSSLQIICNDIDTTYILKNLGFCTKLQSY